MLRILQKSAPNCYFPVAGRLDIFFKQVTDIITLDYARVCDHKTPSLIS